MDPRYSLLCEKAPIIAKHMSMIVPELGQWRVTPRNGNCAVLFQSETELQFTLAACALKAGDGRFCCRVLPAIARQHRYYSFPDIGINVSISRQPLALARDISNRFLRNWNELQKTEVARNQSWIDADNQQTNACRLLAQVTNHALERFKAGLSNTVEVNGIRLDVKVTNGTVTLGARFIDPAQAVAIIQAIRSGSGLHPMTANNKATTLKQDQVEAAALALANYDAGQVDCPLLASIEEFRFDEERKDYERRATVALRAGLHV